MAPFLTASDALAFAATSTSMLHDVSRCVTLLRLKDPSGPAAQALLKRSNELHSLRAEFLRPEPYAAIVAVLWRLPHLQVRSRTWAIVASFVLHAPKLPLLQHLSLPGNKVSADMVEEMRVAWHEAVQLRSLDLSNNPIGASAIMPYPCTARCTSRAIALL